MSLPENADERRMFESNVKTFGSSLKAVQVALAVWYSVAPEGGSYREQLAIMANEVGKEIAKQEGGESH